MLDKAQDLLHRTGGWREWPCGFLRFLTLASREKSVEKKLSPEEARRLRAAQRRNRSRVAAE